MHLTLSFISANYVAREVGFKMTGGWGQGDDAANAFFRPLGTFRERFDALLAHVRGLGFEAIDLWTAHLNPAWATDEHLAIARERLAAHRLTVPSLAGGFGDTLEAFRRSCEVARAVGAPLLGGGTPLADTHRANVVAILREQGVKLALENHPEKTPQAMLDRLGDPAGGLIGVALDTGWFATQGASAAEAIIALRPHLLHVHLKDIKPPRAEKTGLQLIDMGHETCALCDGIADIPACIRALLTIGYSGPIGLEHEPEEFSPDADLRLGLARVRTWFSA
ncbi:MAG TPA: sugar phosphate isomerase/epimerase [Opitutaceae bacterium]